MTRENRQHWNRSGLPKVAYATELEARDEALRTNQTYYQCFICNYWHTGGGHAKRKPK